MGELAIMLIVVAAFCFWLGHANGKLDERQRRRGQDMLSRETVPPEPIPPDPDGLIPPIVIKDIDD
jgi:hypothetical protein